MRRIWLPLTLVLFSCSSGGGRATPSATTSTTGTSTTGTPPSTSPAQPGVSQPDAAGPVRVAVIVLENKESSVIAGNTKAPYVNKLATDYARALNWYGIRHPSLPNYLAMIGGSTFGVTQNCTDCVQTARSLPDQLDDRGLSWKSYQEGLPQPCFTGAQSGRYAKKHNPFVYFTAITSNPQRCARVVPLTQLTTDEQAGKLPRFSFITPDMCNSTHDCGIGVGDKFLSRVVPPLLTALGPQGLLVVTYDEGDSDAGCCKIAAGGKVFTVFAGDLAARGAKVTDALDHYSLLRTIEDLFGLEHLGDAACECTRPASALLH